ncbi:hypothetical protein K493DRAFT_323877 [Basidiobolus meristosporus CBS 931.73]|uniref:AN1-type domain-containing protein n=1 Tax=Basidiobolus meristosporus CBS 931.73 TaxID=1314790 RepID=A0A1Y1YND1_9FUNG|nr:hypothetical protein K493DRAFT_323877 [Basidiobolus meristosporus CBS 931.73]|eukprot:ORX99521.1 hypothetical protein K493DRAFT_323877 [Basidiobolus meristosporus CBS 931.73]
MCSKCFKQLNEEVKTDSSLTLSKPITPSLVSSVDPLPATATEVEITHETPNPIEASVDVAPEIAEPVEESVPRKVQNNKGRCFLCKAKIPLAKQTINKCRCDYVYCDSHRYPDKHECDFDFASQDRNILAKNNPKLNERHTGGRSFTRLED